MLFVRTSVQQYLEPDGLFFYTYDNNNKNNNSLTAIFHDKPGKPVPELLGYKSGHNVIWY